MSPWLEEIKWSLYFTYNFRNTNSLYFIFVLLWTWFSLHVCFWSLNLDVTNKWGGTKEQLKSLPINSWRSMRKWKGKEIALRKPFISDTLYGCCYSKSFDFIRWYEYESEVLGTYREKAIKCKDRNQKLSYIKGFLRKNGKKYSDIWSLGHEELINLDVREKNVSNERAGADQDCEKVLRSRMYCK